MFTSDVHRGFKWVILSPGCFITWAFFPKSVIFYSNVEQKPNVDAGLQLSIGSVWLVGWRGSKPAAIHRFSSSSWCVWGQRGPGHQTHETHHWQITPMQKKNKQQKRIKRKQNKSDPRLKLSHSLRLGLYPDGEAHPFLVFVSSPAVRQPLTSHPLSTAFWNVL